MPGAGRTIKKRILLLFYIFMVLTLVILCRIAYLQIWKGPWLKSQALEQQMRDSTISPKRGTIFDRNKKELAVSATAMSVSVSPNEIKEAQENPPKNGKSYTPEQIAKNLSDILGLDYEETLEKISKPVYYVSIKRKIEDSQADQIRALEMPGVYLDEDTKRYYPNGSLASQVIGFVGIDNQGLDGIEKALDNELKGIPGRVQAAKNARGADMPYQYQRYEEPVNGKGVILTIDATIQHFVENHLTQALIDNKLGNGAAAIIMNPKTGEILAMATVPGYDLNNPMEIVDPAVREAVNSLSGDAQKEARKAALDKQWRNKAVVDTYEPGSTFKLITASIALETGAVSLSDTFYCGGSKKVGNYNIHCWKTRGHGAQTIAEALQNSCNVAFMEIGAKVGAANFIKYFKAFGFTEKTGFLLPGEAGGIFHNPSRFNEVELATCSFGQSFQITPLQLVSAVSAIANGGKLMRPHIVKQYTDYDGNVIENVEPEVIRQVISPQTSAKMLEFMESVVSVGTGKNAYIKGYRVGGKTGTSEKQPRNSGKRIASFVGVAPCDDPQVVCLAILDEPNGYLKQGGQIAAPVVGKILDDTLRYLGVEPKFTQEELATMAISVPEVRQMTVEGAKKAVTDAKLKAIVKGSGDTIVDQVPKPGARVNSGATVILYTAGASVENSATVPDVINMTPNEANKAITNAGLNFKAVDIGKAQHTGTTKAIKQDPGPGTKVPQGTVINVEFRDTAALD